MSNSNSNIFKINSRFAALVEDTNVNKKSDVSNKPNIPNKSDIPNKRESERSTDTQFNNFKRDDRPRYEDRPRYDERRNNFFDPKKESERRLREEQKKKEDEIEKKRKEREEALSDSNFPELNVIKVHVVKEKKGKSFSDKVKEEQKVEIIETPVEEYIQPGYVVISRDKNTNKIIYKYGEQMENSYEEDYSPNKVFECLVELYEKRKENYIELWGEDEYEKQFRFQNYDYDYFDRLDQEYEDELERQRELEIQMYTSSDEDYY